MPGKLFKDKVFCFSGKLSKSQKELEDLVTGNGGEVAKAVSSRVSYLITSKEDLEHATSNVKKAEEEEIPILNEHFVLDSVAKGKLQTEEDYYLKPLGEADEDEQSSDDEPKQTKKRKTPAEPETKEKKPKTTMSTADFLKHAKPIAITMNGNKFEAEPKEFSSGSYGWGIAGKVLKVTVNGQEVSAQVSINLPVRGSKPDK